MLIKKYFTLTSCMNCVDFCRSIQFHVIKKYFLEFSFDIYLSVLRRNKKKTYSLIIDLNFINFANDKREIKTKIFLPSGEYGLFGFKGCVADWKFEVSLSPILIALMY